MTSGIIKLLVKDHENYNDQMNHITIPLKQLKQFFTVSGMTLLSRILGVIREMILSRFLGASLELDACLMAMKFPKFFRKCFSEEGFNSVFVPYLSEFEVKKRNEIAEMFSNKIVSVILYSMLIIVAAVTIFAKKFVLLMAPGYVSDPEKLAMTVEFTRIMFPSVVFLALSAVYSSVLIASQKFGFYTVCPLVINCILIFSILMSKGALHPGFGYSIGLVSATVCQFIYLFIILRFNGLLLPRLTCRLSSHLVRDFFKKLLPVIVSAGVAQINVFVDSFFCSYLETGGITYLYFSDRFIQLPLSLFGISMSIIVLPSISKAIAAKDFSTLHKLSNSSIKFSLLLTIPAVIGLVLFGHWLIDVIYGHGKFTSYDVGQTAKVLQITSFGLPAYVSAKVLASIRFGQKDTKVPVQAAISSICVNIVLNSLLLTKYQFQGLAFSTVVAGYVQMMILKRGKATEIMQQGA